MILIIGGSRQNKLQYVLQKTGCKDCNVVEDFESAKDFEDVGILYNLHYAVREALNTNLDPFLEINDIVSENPDIIIICDEVGCGVVPISPDERLWRETVGRICCHLSGKADRVERIFCGIPMVLKGAGEWN